MVEAATNPDQPGFPRLGSYQVIRQLGSGGMSNVFQAVHQLSGSLVALKVLPRKLAQNPALLQRFLREARSAENLDHPNIVAIYDRGFDQDRHYLVLEFVDGRDLYEHIRNKGVLDNKAAIKLAHAVANGLGYAARLGMIHRDIKPANLLLANDGQVKIIDLGLALQADDEDERVTRQGTTVGTVDYMSPEQARDSRRINEASDIYSLGCTLYYLVTGYPPFPGGTLADKLARHHSAAVPDPRDRNPSISSDLADLIRQMMAKRPADRPLGYDDLIGQLERIAAGQPRLLPPQPLDVLIDDEDDSDDDVVELTLVNPTDAPRGDPRSGSQSSRLAPGRSSVEAAEVSMADLAALDDDNPTRPAAGTRRLPARRAGPRSSVVLDAILESDSPGEEMVLVERSRGELPLRTWIVAGIFVGLGLAALGIAVVILLRSLGSPPDPQVAVVSDEAAVLASSNPVADNASMRTDVPARIRANPTRSAVKRPGATGPDAISPSAPMPTRTAPEVKDRPTDPEVMKRLGIIPDVPEPAIDEVNRVVVRRLDEPGEAMVDSLAVALERAGALVEIADSGPILEDNFRINGKSKVVRGRGGYRPIVQIVSNWQASARIQEAKFLLGGSGVEHLTLQDIDLVVDVRDLPADQGMLFRCQGVDLTFRNCTFTIHNLADRRDGFALIQAVNGPRPNRIRFEQCLVRGPILTLVDVRADRCEIDLVRTVVCGGPAPLFLVGPGPTNERVLRLFQSVVVTGGPLLELANREASISLRCLESTVAHSDQPEMMPWLQVRSATVGDPASGFDYDGESNAWVGWSPATIVGNTPAAPSQFLDELHRTSSRADKLSRIETRPWPAALANPQAVADDFRNLTPELAISLDRVATPHPMLYPMTVDRFPRPAHPDANDPSLGKDRFNPRPINRLTFDPTSSKQADLGLYLQQVITDVSKPYEIRLNGPGPYAMSPVRLPDGSMVSLIGTNLPLTQIVPNRPGSALIEAHVGNLSLENMNLVSDGSQSLDQLLLLVDNSLTLKRCSIRDRGDAGAGDRPAIRCVSRPPPSAALAAGARLPATAPATLTMTDSWIWTNSTSVVGSAAPSAIFLKNCLLLGGPSAITLTVADNPATMVASPANLVLENCSVAAERIAIRFLAGETVGTKSIRPTLIWSRSCVFPRSWRDNGALLGVQAEEFSRGGLFWESSNDLYETTRFVVNVADLVSLPGSSADLKRQWIDLWGSNHTRGDRGPDMRKLERILQFRDKERGRGTRPTPAQLELDPKQHRDQGVNFATLPPLPRS